MEAIGGYLAGLRVRKQKTQEEVASDFQVHKRNITAWENGRLPHMETFARLLEYLDGDPSAVQYFLIHRKHTKKDGYDRAMRPLDKDVLDAIEEMKQTDEGRARLRAASRMRLQE